MSNGASGTGLVGVGELVINDTTRRWWEDGGVEPLPLTCSERLRKRIDRWERITFFLGLALLFVAFVVTYELYAPPDAGDSSFLLMLLIALVMRLIPTYPLASAFMLRRLGARPLRLPLSQTTVIPGFLTFVAIRKDDRWRLARVSSAILDADVLPTADTVTVVAQHRRRIETTRNVSLGMQAILAIVCVPLVAGPLNINFETWWIVTWVAIIGLLGAISDELFLLIDWRLTGGKERPSIRTQREAILRVRAELTEGTRPATLAELQVPLLLQPDVDGVPCLKEYGINRSAANLLAAYCLLDADRLEDAEQVLRHALRVHNTYGGWSYELELSRLLAIVVLCNGGDLDEAHRLRKGGDTGGFDAHDFHVYEALRAHRRGFSRLAPREAAKAIKKMKRSIYPGQALAYEALLRRTLGLPDPEVDIVTAD